jgi:hypothetical protein
MLGIMGLTATNALICPAVTQIMEKMESIYCKESKHPSI